VGEKTIWCEMAELIFEKRLTTGWVGASPFIVVLQPSLSVRLKKG